MGFCADSKQYEVVILHNVIDEIFSVSSVVRIQKAREFGMGFFFSWEEGGVNFWSGDFCGFCWKPYGFFLRFDFYPHSIIPVT